MTRPPLPRGPWLVVGLARSGIAAGRALAAGPEDLQHREPGPGEADHEVRPAGKRRAGVHVTVCW